MNKLTVEVKYSQDGQSFATGYSIPDLFYKAFAPLKKTDIPELSALPDEFCDSEGAEVIMKLRKDASEYIAELLSDHLIKVMSSQDTFNGYKLEVDDAKFIRCGRVNVSNPYYVENKKRGLL